MYSFSNLEPVCCSMFSSNCCLLTCIQVSQEADQVVWYSLLFQNFPQIIVIHTVKGFGIVNKAEIDVFLELSCFFYDPTDVGSLISDSSAFSKSSLNIWKFTVHILSKPGLENFEHYFTSMWDECSCVVVWAFFGMLEWIAIPSSRGSFQTRDWTHISCVSCICRQILYPWATNPKRWCCESAALNMPANLENSAVARGLEKVSFHSNPKERQCQRMLKLLHHCTHLTG